MAAETKIINTLTSVNTIGDYIFIKSEYFADTLPNTISAFIGEIVGSQDSTSYLEGELVIQMINYPVAIDYYINNVGQLIVGSATGDSSYYSINADGELEWTGDDGL